MPAGFCIPTQNKPICFSPCNEWCFVDIQTRGDIYLACFFGKCSGELPSGGFYPYVYLKRQGRPVIEQSADDNHMKESRQSIRVKGSVIIAFNLTAFRRGELTFGRFLANAQQRAIRNQSNVDCTRSLHFIVELDGRRIWDSEKSSSSQIDVEIGPNATILTLRTEIRQYNCTNGNDSETDVVGRWGGARLVPSHCQRHQRLCKEADNSTVQLSCYLGLCPNKCTTKANPPYSYFDTNGQACLSTSVREAFSMSTGSIITYDLSVVAREKPVIFTATIATDQRSCNPNSKKKSTNTTTLTIHLNHRNVYRNDVGKERAQIVVPIVGAATGDLQLWLHHSNCAVVTWTRARLVPPEPIEPFPPCNVACQTSMRDRQTIPLSCFLGTCMGNATTISNPPFTHVHQQSEYTPIRLENQTYEFGIGTPLTGSITFDLNAIRMRGLVAFNHFEVGLAVRKEIGCTSNDNDIWKFRIDLDGVPTINENVAVATRSGYRLRIILNVVGVRHLKLATVRLHGSACSYALWGGAELFTGRVLP